MAQVQYVVAGSGAGSDTFTAIYQTGAAAACPPMTIFTAPVACVVSSVKTIWDTVAGATSTISIFKDTGTAALGAGTLILAAAIDMEGTARTTGTPALAASAATYTLAAGDRLSVKVASGTATASSGVNFTVTLVRS